MSNLPTERHELIPPPPPPPSRRGGLSLEEWWIELTKEDIAATRPKTQEYGGLNGSADLQLIGENLALLLGKHEIPDAVKQELGCWFYVQGKVARLVSDYQHGRPGKPDTWTDIAVYTTMVRRLQATGRWP